MQTQICEPATDERLVAIWIAMPDPAEIARTWPHREGLYSRALERSYQRADTVETVSDMLARGRAWAFDAMCGDGMIGSCVVEREFCKDGVWLNIWCLAGQSLDDWFDPMLDAIEEWSRRIDCEGVRFAGRKGWAKMMRRRGYNQKMIVMDKRV